MSTCIPHLDVGSGRQRGAITLFLVRALGRATLRDGVAAGAARSVRSDGSRLQVCGVRSLVGTGEPLLHLTAFYATHPLLAAA